ncbi:restriction endonuclease subunit S [Burkholderia pseudomallei]|uniref:restriction endonuclease subunit S n=1 Tax=Burkholderia pseudomallei TaxID=28450 RepID=UPI00016B0992|nr:restriction endonuclease subunit S [Burkholderia pseudomallei]
MSLPGYPQYKDSGASWLGRVPTSWAVVQARRLFEQRRDAALPGDEQLSASQKYGVVPQRLFMELEDQKVVLALSGLENFKHVEPNDFVISLRSFQGGIEHSAFGGCVSPAYTVLRATSKIAPDFWAYLLKSDTYISALQTVTDGIRDGKNISYMQFGALCVPVPNIDEQSAIAAFLDCETGKIDALIAEQEKLIALLAEKRQAALSYAVTRGLNPDAPMKDSGVAWLGEVPAHWVIRRVKSVSVFMTSGPRGWSERISDEGSIFVQSGDLNDFLGVEFEIAKRVSVEFDAEAERTRLANGDVVVCITGAKTGKVAVCASVPEPAYVNQHLCLIRPSPDVLPLFLGNSLKSTIGQTQFELSQYGLKQGLSLDNVREALIVLPPPGEQVEIVTFIDAETARLDELKAEAARAIELLKERRSALIAAAVTGKIDVRNAAPQELAA